MGCCCSCMRNEDAFVVAYKKIATILNPEVISTDDRVAAAVISALILLRTNVSVAEQGIGYKQQVVDSVKSQCGTDVKLTYIKMDDLKTYVDSIDTYMNTVIDTGAKPQKSRKDIAIKAKTIIGSDRALSVGNLLTAIGYVCHEFSVNRRGDLKLVVDQATEIVSTAITDLKVEYEKSMPDLNQDYIRKIIERVFVALLT